MNTLIIGPPLPKWSRQEILDKVPEKRLRDSPDGFYERSFRIFKNVQKSSNIRISKNFDFARKSILPLEIVEVGIQNYSHSVFGCKSYKKIRFLQVAEFLIGSLDDFSVFGSWV